MSVIIRATADRKIMINHSQTWNCQEMSDQIKSLFGGKSKVSAFRFHIKNSHYSHYIKFQLHNFWTVLCSRKKKRIHNALWEDNRQKMSSATVNLVNDWSSSLTPEEHQPITLLIYQKALFDASFYFLCTEKYYQSRLSEQVLISLS